MNIVIIRTRSTIRQTCSNSGPPYKRPRFTGGGRVRYDTSVATSIIVNGTPLEARSPSCWGTSRPSYGGGTLMIVNSKYRTDESAVQNSFKSSFYRSLSNSHRRTSCLAATAGALFVDTSHLVLHPTRPASLLERKFRSSLLSHVGNTHCSSI